MDWKKLKKWFEDVGDSMPPSLLHAQNDGEFVQWWNHAHRPKEKEMKPSKDEYFMSIAKLCSTRSIDPSTKHGCVAVDDSGAILSTGYNGPPRMVQDDMIPLTRPEKYLYFEHSERNCIYNAARIGIPLEGCTFYVTGIPCPECMRAMYQVGCNEIVMLSKKSDSTDESWYEIIQFLEKYIIVRQM